MGKALILAAGEQQRWDSSIPKQLFPVFDGEQLIKRTVRQVRSRMSNYPHIVSHQKCFRAFTPNYIYPSARRYICETLVSVSPIWGKDWTMVLLGDVIYTDETLNLIYDDRMKYDYHFYGTGSEIFSLTFTDNYLVREALYDAVDDASIGNSQGKLWELYYRLSGLPMELSGNGRIANYPGTEDKEHYTFILDDTVDFDTLESYKEWTKRHLLNK